MADISSIGQGAVGPLNRYDGPNSTEHHARRDPREDVRRSDRRDRVELSDHARYLARLRDAGDASPARQRRIAELREAIANGTYETEERLDAAIKGLISDLEA